MSGPSTHLQFVPARVLSSFRYDGLAIGKEDQAAQQLLHNCAVHNNPQGVGTQLSAARCGRATTLFAKLLSNYY